MSFRQSRSRKPLPKSPSAEPGLILRANMATQLIAVAGSSGRMGRALIEAVSQSADFRLKAALERPDSEFLGKDAGELIGSPNGVKIGGNVEAGVEGCDVMVDFTRPEGT